MCAPVLFTVLHDFDPAVSNVERTPQVESRLKTLVKVLLPRPFRLALRRVEEVMNRREFIAGWSRVRSRLNKPVEQEVQHLLIYPSDPATVIGALGDDAMISAVVQRYRDKAKNIRVSVLCARTAFSAVERLGLLPVELPDRFTAHWISNVLRTGGFTDLALLGADIMDGYYAVMPIVRMLVTADIAARLGIRSTFLGFSFNKLPAPSLAAVYKQIDAGVKFNLRDPQSFLRFSEFVGKSPALVADTAFLMRPGEGDIAALTWIADQRSAGRTIIGFNAHAMLVKYATDADRDAIVEACVGAIERASRDRKVSWLLLPHDYRGGLHGDAACLKPIYDRLVDAPDVSVRYLSGMHRAWDLKATAAALDGVITGRMHLAIASLGTGVPTACLTYQNKFEGLFEHFNLPSEYLMAPDVLKDAQKLDVVIESFLDSLSVLRERVAGELPKVLQLSERTFSFLN